MMHPPAVNQPFRKRSLDLFQNRGHRIRVFVWYQQQMDVIRHEDIRPQPKMQMQSRGIKRFSEQRTHAIVDEDLAALVATARHKVRVPGDVEALARHHDSIFSECR